MLPEGVLIANCYFRESHFIHVVLLHIDIFLKLQVLSHSVYHVKHEETYSSSKYQQPYDPEIEKVQLFENDKKIIFLNLLDQSFMQTSWKKPESTVVIVDTIFLLYVRLTERIRIIFSI